MIQLTETLWAIKVPKDAYDYFIGYFSKGLCYRGGENKPQQNIIELNDSNFEIVGAVTKDSIDFDCKDFTGWFYDNDGIKGYYLYPDRKMLTNSAIDSFRSLLNSKGVYFTNPLEYLKPYIMKGSENSISENEFKQIESYESNLWEKALIIQTKK